MKLDLETGAQITITLLKETNIGAVILAPGKWTLSSERQSGLGALDGEPIPKIHGYQALDAAELPRPPRKRRKDAHPLPGDQPA